MSNKVKITWNEDGLENYSNKNQELIEQIKSLNFKGSENLHFDDIAINYSINGISEIVKFCNKIYKNGVEHLIVWASHKTKQSIQACLNFLFGQYDPNAENKIKIYFISGLDELRVTKKKLNKYFQEDVDNKIAIAFLDGFIEASPEKINQIINITLSKFNEKTSRFLIKKLIYFIGKNEWLKYLENHEIPNENIFLISSDIHDKYAFFSEISLVILATQGVNIQKLVEGYKNSVQNIFNYDLYFNSALKLAWYLSQNDGNIRKVERHKLSHINLFISYDTFLNNSAGLMSYLLNFSTLQKNAFCDFAAFPEDITKVGQAVLSDSISKLIIYLNFQQKEYDFQPTSLISDEDMLSKYEHASLQQINKNSLNAFNDYLLSFNDYVDVLKIDFDRNSEEVFGEFMSILYWSKIFYCIINDLNPFKT
ncbi:hypothetical protein [Mycoplasmopsis edwardii]|nr:hypothetical protein [Mycoplasmopsis edwardii]